MSEEPHRPPATTRERTEPTWAPRGTLVLHDSRAALAVRLFVNGCVSAGCVAFALGWEGPLGFALALLGMVAFGSYAVLLAARLLVRGPALVLDPHGILDRRLSQRSRVTRPRLAALSPPVPGCPDRHRRGQASYGCGHLELWAGSRPGRVSGVEADVVVAVVVEREPARRWPQAAPGRLTACA